MIDPSSPKFISEIMPKAVETGPIQRRARFPGEQRKPLSA